MAANTPPSIAKKQVPASGATVADAAPASSRGQKPADHKLTLDELLAWLLADKLVTQEVAEKLLALRQNFRANPNHPLTILADQKWKDPRNPKKLLTLEALTEWLSGKVGLPYFHIDPFKIDFAAVTKVMSNAYAE